MAWEDKEKSKEACIQMIQEAAKNQADVIVFPEMTLTGFSFQVEKCGETEEQPDTVSFFKEASLKYGIAILFGYIQKTKDKALNRAALVTGEQVLLDYAKLHPFSYGEEALYFKGGDALASCELKEFHAGVFICYDLRFPEIFQISSNVNEVIFVIASWPTERIKHWEILLQARAVENQCYIIGVNRVGEGGGKSYAGSSMAFDPLGNKITKPLEGEGLLYADIEPFAARKLRKEFPVKADRRTEFYRNLI